MKVKRLRSFDLSEPSLSDMYEGGAIVDIELAEGTRCPASNNGGCCIGEPSRVCGRDPGELSLEDRNRDCDDAANGGVGGGGIECGDGDGLRMIPVELAFASLRGLWAGSNVGAGTSSSVVVVAV